VGRAIVEGDGVARLGEEQPALDHDAEAAGERGEKRQKQRRNPPKR